MSTPRIVPVTMHSGGRQATVGVRIEPVSDAVPAYRLVEDETGLVLGRVRRSGSRKWYVRTPEEGVQVGTLFAAAKVAGSERASARLRIQEERARRALGVVPQPAPSARTPEWVERYGAY